MMKFEANKTYNEYSTNGKPSSIKCVKVTAKTATFETVYGVKRMKINRECQAIRETINTPYGTTIEA